MIFRYCASFRVIRGVQRGVKRPSPQGPQRITEEISDLTISNCLTRCWTITKNQLAIKVSEDYKDKSSGMQTRALHFCSSWKMFGRFG